MMKAERLAAVFFVSALFLLMCLVPVSMAVKQINKLSEVQETLPDPIEWEKLYPFYDDEPHGIIEEKESAFEYVKRKVDEYTSQFLLGYRKLTEDARKYEEYIGWNMASVFSYNPVIKLNDGWLTGYSLKRDVADFTRDAEAVKNFADFCTENGAALVYINLPAKVCASEDREISGILDYTNQNADSFLEILKASGIRYYDFRRLLHSEGKNHHKAFYVTDHHWKPETGLWAAGHILRILRDDLGWEVDPDILRPENFRYDVYPDWFLGSQGKKLTLVRAKPEDFTMIYPKFETRIKFYLPDERLDVSGDFGITYDMDSVIPKDYYGKNPYGSYIYADRPMMMIENMNNSDGKKILLIHDSMSNCVFPFVALGVEYSYSIDLRHFTGSLKRFITEKRPDAVIVAYLATIPGRSSKPSPSRTDKKLYDFR